MGFDIPNDPTAGVHPATWQAQAQIDSGDFAILAAGIAGTGVVSACAVTAQAAPNGTVAVAAGSLAIAGVTAAVTALSLAVGAGGAQARFDLVVASAAGAVSVVAGAPSNVPDYPAIPAASVVLAAIYVPPYNVAVTAEQIMDKRVTAAALSLAQNEPWTYVVLPAAGGGYLAVDRTGLVAAANADVTALTRTLIAALAPGAYVGSILFGPGDYTWGGPGSEIPAIPAGIGGYGTVPTGRLVIKGDTGALFHLTVDCPSLFDFAATGDAGYATFQNLVLDGLVVDGGGEAAQSAARFRHLLLGTKGHAGVSGQTISRANYRNIVVRNCVGFNAPIDPTNTAVRLWVDLSIYATANTDINPAGPANGFNGQPITALDILFEDNLFYGANGMQVYGAGWPGITTTSLPGPYPVGYAGPLFEGGYNPLYMDRVHVHRCKSIMVTPAGALVQRKGFLSTAMDNAQLTMQSEELRNYPTTAGGARAYTITVETEPVVVTAHAFGSDIATITRAAPVAHANGAPWTRPAWGANFQMGSQNQGGYLHMADCYAYGSGDVTYETDGWDHELLEACVAEEGQGGGFYHVNWCPPRNPKEQLVIYRACRSRRVVANVGFGFVWNTQRGFGAGSVTYDNCEVILGNPGDFGVSGSAFQINHTTGPAQRLTFINPRVIRYGWNVNLAAAVGESLIYVGGNHPGGGVKTLIMRSAYLYVAGTLQSATTAAPSLNLIELHGGVSAADPMVLDIDAVTYDMHLTSWVNAVGSSYVSNGIWLHDGFLQGRIANLRVPSPATAGLGSMTVILVPALGTTTSTVTLSPTLDVVNIDTVNVSYGVRFGDAPTSTNAPYLNIVSGATFTTPILAPGGVVGKVKTGVPTDADWLGGVAPDGAEIVDNTAGTGGLWKRMAGVWTKIQAAIVPPLQLTPPAANRKALVVTPAAGQTASLVEMGLVTIFNDTFTGAAATSLSAHNADSGQGPYVLTTGTFTLDGANKVQFAWNGVQADQYAIIDNPGGVDGVLSARLFLSAVRASLGLMLKAIDSGNWLSVQVTVTPTNNSVRLWKRVASGAGVTLSQVNLALALGSSPVLSAVVLGDHIQVYVDGVLKIDHTLSAGDYATFGPNTRIGLNGGMSATGDDGASKWGPLTFQSAAVVVDANSVLLTKAGLGLKRVSGAGRITGADGDFPVTPPDGTTYQVHDATTGRTYLTTRDAGAWRAVEFV